MTTPSLLVVGFGAIASALHAETNNAEPKLEYLGLRRNIEALPKAVTPIKADFKDRTSMRSALTGLGPDYVLLTLTPAAFTEQDYQEAYLGGLRNTLDALEKAPRRIFFFSTTSVYAQNNDEWIDESSAASSDSFSARTMLACEALLSETEWATTCLRAGGIYGGGSRRLVDKIARGESSGSQHFSNRVHVEDCARAVAHLIQRDQRGLALESCYLAVDNTPTKMAEVERWIAAELGVEYRCAQSAQRSRRKVNSKRCSNARLRASGFECRYPDLRSGYKALLSRN